MKLVTFSQSPTSVPKTGVVIPSKDGSSGKIIDLYSAASFLLKKGKLFPAGIDPNHLKDMLSLIRSGPQTLNGIQEIENLYGNGVELPSDCVFPETSSTILSPIPTPLSMRDGYAFRQHVEAARRNRGVEMIPEFDQFPVFYFTNHLAVTGPGDLPVQSRAQEKLDFELEVAIVVGKEGKNIPAHQADDYIFGYMIMNDWSARAMQMQEMKMSLGPAKGKDFATSLGPYLVPRKSLAPHVVQDGKGVGERHDLEMKAFVNDVQVSKGNLKDISWTFAQILERVSYGVTIHPGEVIGSGTVGTGCFLELNGSKITDNQWLRPGDQVVLEVSELGTLKNTIVDGGQ